MKKALVMVFAVVFVLSAGVFASMNMGGGGMKGCMMGMKADVKVENVADGVKVMCTSKDAKEVKGIQEAAAEMLEMHAKMMKENGEGMDKMWERGMGMDMKDKMMGHMHKKMGVIFGFLTVIWSLLIILMASTIVLIIKKIMAK